MELKKPATFEEQLVKIKEHGCFVEDEEYALSVLRRINYYRLAAYFLPFKNSKKEYTNISFNKIMKIYEFDKRLRYLVFDMIEDIEILLRTEIAYYFSHKYGELGYMNEDNFNSKHNHKQFENKIFSSIEKNKNQLFVKHHIEKYDYKFPLWVLVELFTFGDLSRFYDDMQRQDKKTFAKTVFNAYDTTISSWLYCLTRLRNYCAHYTRLYYNRMAPIPYTPKEHIHHFSNTLFDYLMVLKELYPLKTKWSNFLINVSSLLEEYSDSITLSHIGFKNNWLEALS